MFTTFVKTFLLKLLNHYRVINNLIIYILIFHAETNKRKFSLRTVVITTCPNSSI
jgi:hypothetical protein